MSPTPAPPAARPLGLPEFSLHRYLWELTNDRPAPSPHPLTRRTTDPR